MDYLIIWFHPQMIDLDEQEARKIIKLLYMFVILIHEQFHSFDLIHKSSIINFRYMFLFIFFCLFCEIPFAKYPGLRCI